MVVSAVDLLYVCGRYLVMSDHVTLMTSSLGTTVVFLVLSVVPRRCLQQCYNIISVSILV